MGLEISKNQFILDKLKTDYPCNIRLMYFSPQSFRLCKKEFLLQKVKCHFKMTHSYYYGGYPLQ